MAALLSKSPTTITGLQFLDRGYENLVEKLQGLGADIKRKKQGKEISTLAPAITALKRSKDNCRLSPL